MEQRERLELTIQNRINESRNRNGTAVTIALSTLREMQAFLEKVKPMEMELEGGGSTWWYACPECHGAIDKADSYCRYCGQAVK